MPAVTTEPKSREDQVKDAYIRVIREPFEEKYEDKWEEDNYWAAVEAFKVEVKEIGFEDPFEVLSKYRLTSFDQIHDKLKAGPPACFREGWKCTMIGTKIDTTALVAPLEHVNGPKYNGEERIVVLEFWATWCPPCVRDGPELSELSEKYAGRVAIVGINNESIFAEQEHDVAKVQTFLETNKAGFRYTIYVDTPDGHARESVYKKSEYRAIPCVIVVVDGVVLFVGEPGNEFKAVLEEALAVVAAKEE
ncbi:hypothetical protein BGZ98_009274 [Dissophora globulifera]|nr:hypothetical protein BGZ98_009274 [Dissophora globulifera]